MGNPYHSLCCCKNQYIRHRYQQIFGLYQDSETSWSVIPPFSIVAEPIITRPIEETPNMAVTTSGFFGDFNVFAILAPDHRHSVNCGQAVKHPLHDGSSHPITTKALSCIIRIN